MKASLTTKIKLYVDSASTKDWEEWIPKGLFYGITTNPLLLDRANESCTIENLTILANKGLKLGAKEFQIQIWSNDKYSMYEIGKQVSEISEKIVLKIPMCLEGIEAAKKLIQENKKITMTGIYSSYQAFISMSVGVNYIAPYLGRMNESNINGIDEIIEMNNIKKETNSNTKILVASLRNINEVSLLASKGLTTFTINPKILKNFFINEHTAKIINEFDKALENTGGK